MINMICNMYMYIYIHIDIHSYNPGWLYTLEHSASKQFIANWSTSNSYRNVDDLWWFQDVGTQWCPRVLWKSSKIHRHKDWWKSDVNKMIIHQSGVKSKIIIPGWCFLNKASIFFHPISSGITMCCFFSPQYSPSLDLWLRPSCYAMWHPTLER